MLQNLHSSYRSVQATSSKHAQCSYTIYLIIIDTWLNKTRAVLLVQPLGQIMSQTTFSHPGHDIGLRSLKKIPTIVIFIPFSFYLLVKYKFTQMDRIPSDNTGNYYRNDGPFTVSLTTARRALTPGINLWGIPADTRFVASSVGWKNHCVFVLALRYVWRIKESSVLLADVYFPSVKLKRMRVVLAVYNPYVWHLQMETAFRYKREPCQKQQVNVTLCVTDDVSSWNLFGFIHLQVPFEK